MITRYALGPHITLIGRERVKRAEKQCRCQVRFFTWRKNKRTPGKRPRLSRLCAKAAERQTGLSGSAAPSPPGPRRPSDRKPEPSSLPSVPPAGRTARPARAQRRPRQGQAASQGQAAGGPTRGPWARRPPAGRGVSSPGPGERRPLRFTDASSPWVSTSPRTHSGPGSVGTLSGGWSEAAPGLCGEKGPAERQCEARPPGTVTAACSRGRGHSDPRRPAGVHVKTRFPHLDGKKADF